MIKVKHTVTATQMAPGYEAGVDESIIEIKGVPYKIESFGDLDVHGNLQEEALRQSVKNQVDWYSPKRAPGVGSIFKITLESRLK